MARPAHLHFQDRAREALADKHLQDSLNNVAWRFHDWRTASIAEFGPGRWEALRERASAIKTHTLENLDYYIDLFSRRVEDAGGHVHFAAGADEAREIVLELARSRGVKLVVKSKSMVSEELELNHHLGEAGVESVETDLGEYIAQLAGRTPFHIIAPVMQMTRHDVSELFQKKLGAEPTDDIPTMAGTARRTLRDKFLRADMGITGANFLIAESGTLVLVTNEGNGRFCTSTPRIHVAIAGMEKLLPTLEDLNVLLRLLPRSATGQRLSSYTTFVSGPRREDDEDGPEEFHVVLVDNRRLSLLKDTELRQTLKCIRCAACLNICPVYRKVGGHAYGYAYPGPIGSIVSPAIFGLAEAKDLPSACSLCGACRDVCPVKIDLPDMLLKLRNLAAEGASGQRKRSRIESISFRAFLFAMTHPRLLGVARTAGRWAMLPLARKGRVGHIPLPIINRWTRRRDLPVMPPKTFHQLWREQLADPGLDPGEVPSGGKKERDGG